MRNVIKQKERHQEHHHQEKRKWVHKLNNKNPLKIPQAID